MKANRAVLSCGAVWFALQRGCSLKSVEETFSVSIQEKATEQYFPLVLFIFLYKVVLTFKSVDEILKCARLNESY